ncbi:thiamine pyrophosphate-binding protein [Haloferula sp. BvORR071]|uniref:thiamine pyrophosphate-binding protein n=1 Tax=Haloferula sp. BvORR071 TaxID=1396141 RepID=UPI00054E7F68|nr:thiamine pyrophosphate-binding protein [Haloferula sp. BvORR071]
MTTWEAACSAINTCLRQGVREFVVCAGARNAALVEVLARAEAAGEARLWRHFEERSAGFFALGRTMATGEACAVVTTSGTAVAELLPAVVEAFYQARPLLALTADRPERFRGTGAPQAITQPGIFGEHAGDGDIAEWLQRGPWHWNVELEEDFQPGEWIAPSDDELREIPPPNFSVAALAHWLREDLYRGLVVMVGDLEPEDQEPVFHLCIGLGVPVAVEATSGLREALGEICLPDPDRMLRECPPGKVLRIGGVPSGRFWRDLEDLPETEVWNITRTGFPGLARKCETITSPVGRAIKGLGDVEKAGDALDYFRRTSRRAGEIEDMLEAYPDSEPGLLRVLSAYASTGSSLYLGNSMPIREWNLFAQRGKPVTDVRANRGANGIDGQLSTWLGWTADVEDAWCLVGDLTALYDLAAPAWLGQIERKGRVLVVINNGGGQIFSRLPRLDAMQDRAKELMLNPHELRLEGWATMWGMKYLRVESEEGFDALEPGEATLLVEVIPNGEESAAFWKAWDTAR